MSGIQKLYFHESDILKFQQIEGSLYLDLNNVMNEENNSCNVSIICKGITNFDSDAKLNSSDLKSHKEGGVVTLKIDKNRLELIVEWLDFEHHSSSMNFYYIDCKEIEVKVHKA